VPRLTAVLTLLLAVPLAACGQGDESSDPSAAAPSPTTHAAKPTGTAGAAGISLGGSEREVLTSGLETPTAVAFLPDGSALVAERDSGRILQVTSGKSKRAVGTVPGLDTSGDGGLLGLAVPPATLTGGRSTVYVYYTSRGENRIARLPYQDGRLGAPREVLDGIPAGKRHNGGGLAVGPDGKLYAGTGDVTGTDGQRRGSLAGKVLRLDLDGSVPADNPFRGSPVYSTGHRDVPSVAFDSRGGLWAVDVGQESQHELNHVVRGGNFGWPVVEGKHRDDRFLRPYFEWDEPDEVSPHGIAIRDDVLYAADPRGGNLHKIPLEPSERPSSWGSWSIGLFDSPRALAVAPSGELWVAASDRDPDGTAGPVGDGDRVLRITLADDGRTTGIGQSGTP
jgi:glucose/arabinose dehydrogenase